MPEAKKKSRNLARGGKKGRKVGCGLTDQMRGYRPSATHSSQALGALSDRPELER